MIYGFFIKPTILSYEGCDKIAENVLINRLNFFFPNISIVDDIRNIVGETDDIIICFDLAAPLFDEEALKKSIHEVSQLNKPLKIVQKGLVGGTAIRYICKFSNYNHIVELKEKELFFDTQEVYSTQFNLYKLKRQKIFKYLISKFPEISTMPILEFLDWCGTDMGVKTILTYGETVELIKHDSCPYCHSRDLKDLHHEMLHPTIGFLTKESHYYSFCNQCGLVYLKYTFPFDELFKIYDKYETEIEVRETSITNITSLNTSHYENYIATFDFIDNRKLKTQNILDIGCGRCQFISLAKNRYNNARVKGIDFDLPLAFTDELEKRSIEWKNINFIQELSEEKEKYNLITMWEVIEHIPIDLLKNCISEVLNLLEEDGYFVFSTPDFDDPFCKLFDFWSTMPIHHLSVLSKKWLYEFIESCGGKVIGELHESVTFKEGSGWAAYSSEFARTQKDQAVSEIFNDLIADSKTLESFNETRRSNSKGSEIILFVQRK